MIFKTRAKVNLTLEIISRRNDGWHMLDTVFWPLSAGDRIFAERRPSGLAFSCSDKTLETEGNLAVRAFRLMQERFGFAEGLSLHLEKHVPSQAGLGGGSGDAACVLRICNEVFGLGLSQEQLARALFPLGDRTKADVRRLAAEAGLPMAEKPDSQDFYSGDCTELLGAADEESGLRDGGRRFADGNRPHGDEHGHGGNGSLAAHERVEPFRRHESCAFMVGQDA